MHIPAPLAIHDFHPSELPAVVEFLKRARSELRSLHRALVWADEFQVFDINRDYFQIRGIGYGDPEIVPPCFLLC